MQSSNGDQITENETHAHTQRERERARARDEHEHDEMPQKKIRASDGVCNATAHAIARKKKRKEKIVRKKKRQEKSVLEKSVLENKRKERSHIHVRLKYTNGISTRLMMPRVTWYRDERVSPCFTHAYVSYVKLSEQSRGTAPESMQHTGHIDT